MRTILLIGALSTLAATPAAAQTGGKYAVGMKMSTHLPGGDNTDSKMSPGLLWRIGHSKTGWGWDWGLNWFSTNLDREFGDQRVELGRLRIRPIMAGYGYTRVIGRTSISAKMLAGYAFNTVSITPNARNSFLNRLGAQNVDSDTENTIVARPGVNVWYDLNEKIGINIGAGYVIARPRVTVRSTLGEDIRRVNADMLSIRFGMVYSVR